MYFGSVRFFKNMLLLAIVIMITVLSGTTFYYRSQWKSEQAEAALPANDVSSLNADVNRLTAALEEQSAEEAAAAVPKNSLPAFEVPSYQSLYPDFYAPQPLQADQRTENTIFLTFDDGPSARTDEILKILAQQDVKATFFVVGASNEQSAQRMRNIVEQGHTLGMHSYSHQYNKIYSSVEAYLDDMYQLFTLIRETTGETPTVFRFPGGSINAYNYAIYQELITEMLRRGFVPCDWNISSEDATGQKLSSDAIVNNVVQRAAQVERGFVLMHDSEAKISTVQALNPMINRLRDMGFQFERLMPETKPIMCSYRE